MFIMQLVEVHEVLRNINDYLSNCLWMDFEFYRMDAGEIMIVGSIDQSNNKNAIEIIFEQPHFISTLFIWQTDTTKPLIQIATDEEETEMNTKYRVEQGNYIFKINVADFDKPTIWIAAKKITCKILDTNPFLKY